MTWSPSKFCTCYSLPLEYLVKYVLLSLLFIFLFLIFCRLRLFLFPFFSFTLFYFIFCVPYFSHSVSAPISLSFSSLCLHQLFPIMRIHCPNPGCPCNLHSSSKPFMNEAGFSIHLSKSPTCKAYFLKLSANTNTTTTTTPCSSRPASTFDPTAYVFKKRRLMFNPCSSHPSSTPHPKNTVFSDNEATHNDTPPLPPTNDIPSLLMMMNPIFLMALLLTQMSLIIPMILFPPNQSNYLPARKPCSPPTPLLKSVLHPWCFCWTPSNVPITLLKRSWTGQELLLLLALILILNAKNVGVTWTGCWSQLTIPI